MTNDELQSAIRSSRRVRIVGGGSKPALSAGASIDMSDRSGILQYDPSEYTFTALAGTRLEDVVSALAEHRQYLPFDPPLVAAGATLGGTVAAGLSGSGRLRYGGVRDFLLGVKLITGTGRLVFGGGKVVKNAAGFDIPKLMVGSLGRFGVMIELTFKVFPQPQACATVVAQAAGLDDALGLMTRMANSQEELAAIDFVPPGKVLLRVGGLRDALDQRVQRIRRQLWTEAEVVTGEQEAEIWALQREFSWLPIDTCLVKVPLASEQVQAAESHLDRFETPIARRYSVAGNLLWIAWPNLPRTKLEGFCARLGRRGLALTGRWDNPLIGQDAGQAFADRLQSVFDPEAKLSYCGS